MWHEAMRALREGAMAACLVALACELMRIATSAT